MRPALLYLTLGVLGLAGPAWGFDVKVASAKAIQVPYRLTDTKHVLVRAKINGKGPYNFIVDTGAPTLFVATSVCRKLGIEPDKGGWGTFDRFEIEGGAVITKARGRIEDPFQLESMNGLGLAGAELHGIIGYTLLARYKMEFDFTKDKMAWLPLNFTPPIPMGIGGGGAPAGMDAMAGIMKMVGAFLGKRAKPDVLPRGFLGIQVAEKDDAVTVSAVLAKSPAATAELKVGDRISEFQGKNVKTAAELHKLAAKVPAGKSVKL